MTAGYRYTTINCVRVWRWYANVGAPQPVQALAACTRALAVVGGLAVPYVAAVPFGAVPSYSEYAPGYGAYETTGSGLTPPGTALPGPGVLPVEGARVGTGAGNATGGLPGPGAGGGASPPITYALPSDVPAGLLIPTPSVDVPAQPVAEPSALLAVATGLVVVWLVGMRRTRR